MTQTSMHTLLGTTVEILVRWNTVQCARRSSHKEQIRNSSNAEAEDKEHTRFAFLHYREIRIGSCRYNTEIRDTKRITPLNRIIRIRNDHAGTATGGT